MNCVFSSCTIPAGDKGSTPTVCTVSAGGDSGVGMACCHSEASGWQCEAKRGVAWRAVAPQITCAARPLGLRDVLPATCSTEGEKKRTRLDRSALFKQCIALRTWRRERERERELASPSPLFDQDRGEARAQLGTTTRYSVPWLRKVVGLRPA